MSGSKVEMPKTMVLIGAGVVLVVMSPSIL